MVLWLFVVVLLLRGLVSLFVSDDPKPVFVLVLQHVAVAVWLDDEVCMFVVDFVRVYLSFLIELFDSYVMLDVVDSIASVWADGGKL